MARYKIDCCQNCPDRHPGCHGHCEKYIQERAEYDETMAEKRKETDLRNGLNSFMYDSIEKNKQVYQLPKEIQKRSLKKGNNYVSY